MQKYQQVWKKWNLKHEMMASTFNTYSFCCYTNLDDLKIRKFEKV